MDEQEASGTPVSEAPKSYEICISVSGDQISVGVGSGGVESGHEGEVQDGGESASMKPVGSIREAMSVAMEIYQNDGAMPDGSDDKEFDGGFGKAKPAPKDKMFNEE